VDDRLYSTQIKEGFQNITPILVCGDLPGEYLESPFTSLIVPMLIMPGDHNPAYGRK
jgi:hypothetical protein